MPISRGAGPKVIDPKPDPESYGYVILILHFFCWFLLANFNPFFEALLYSSFLTSFPRSIFDLQVTQTITRRRRRLRRRIHAVGGFPLFAVYGNWALRTWNFGHEEQDGSLYSLPVSLVIWLDQKSDPTSSINLIPDFRKPEWPSEPKTSSVISAKHCQLYFLYRQLESSFELTFSQYSREF